MKKVVYFLVTLTVLISLAGCNQQAAENNVPKEKTNANEPKAATETKKVTEPKESAESKKATETKKAAESEKAEVKQEAPSKTESQAVPKESAENKSQPKVYRNVAFKDVVVSETANKVVVSGKAQVFEGMFQYALYDGNKKIFENNYQTEGAPSWGDFKITFDKKFVTSDQIKFQLFDYSEKDGSKINVLEIPVPQK